MSRQIFAGATNQSIDIFIPDASSTNGQGLAGLTYTSGGLKIYYRRGYNGAPAQVFPLVSLANAQASWFSGGFVEIDAVNMKGWYRVDLPNNAFLAGVNCVGVMVFGAANMVPVPIDIQLTAYDPYAVPISLVDFFTSATGKVFADAVNQSVVKEMATGAGQSGITQQFIADAGKLAPAAGSPATGSVIQLTTTAANAVDNEVASILAKVTPLTYTTTNRVDATSTLVPGSIDAGAFNANTDVYQAKISYTDDETNLSDRYTVSFYKNGAPVTSGIASPTIQVVKVTDGGSLVSTVSLTQIANTGYYKYTETSNRVVSGASYIAVVNATINLISMNWSQPFGRDSA